MKDVFQVAISQGATPCPNCMIMFVKDGGCDHMQCSACKYDFSWEAARNKFKEILARELLLVDQDSQPTSKYELQARGLKLVDEDKLTKRNVKACLANYGKAKESLACDPHE